MKTNDDQFINTLTKAKIVNELLNLADSMFNKKDLPNRTASVLLYFNLAEWYLSFLVRRVPLNLNQNTFNESPMGNKINMLKEQKFYYKNELLSILEEFNRHRINIVHNVVEAIFDKKMEKSINETKRLFDELNKCLVLIAKHYGIAS